MMKKLYKCADQLDQLLRCALLALVTSQGLYLVMAVLFDGVLNTDVFMTRNHLIEPLRDWVMLPWSGALLATWLARGKKNSGPDTFVLMLLMLWIAVPFLLRFGTEYHTMRAIYGYGLSFVVFYISVREGDAQSRACQLDVACAGFGVLSIALGGALLYCAATGKNYCSYWDTEFFGVVNGQLQHATHYNSTAMLALICTLMCLAGLCRSKRKPILAFYLLGMMTMALVVVLTQSRTARYAMLAVFALGTWNGLAEYLPIRKGIVRHGAALAMAVVVLVGGYKLCGTITDAALAHYAGRTPQLLEAVLPTAVAEDTEEAVTETAQPVPMKARSQKVDATFSDRTNIWKNVFISWVDNPWHMLIGHGSGRTKWLVAQDTIHESLGFAKVHNAYLNFAAEYGMIGFFMLATFMLIILPSVLRVFFAHGKKRMPGGCALCMLVLAILATGMMENEPLDILTPMNFALFFVLAQLTAAGREMKAHKFRL